MNLSIFLLYFHRWLRLFSFISLFVFILLGWSLLNPKPAWAGGVVTDCSAYNAGNANDLESALVGGGSVTFNCGGVGAAATITIPTAQVTLPGSGTLTLDGGNVITLQGDGLDHRIFRSDSATAAVITITRITLANAYSPSNDGGAIGVVNTGALVLNVISTTFSNNLGASGGAISINNANAILNIADSTFVGNTMTAGTNGGGAIRFAGAQLHVSNSTFYNNKANGTGRDGGALYLNSGTTRITHTTIFSNYATGSGGGIRFGGTSVIAINSIVAGNGAPAAARDNCTGALSAGSSNNFETNDATGNCATGFTQDTLANFRFAPIANNGGGTQTIALFAGSTAIDTVACVAGTTTDQRGVSRPQDIPSFGIGTCDAGAYEFAVSERPNITISDTSANEGTSAVVTLTLSSAISQNVTVNYSMAVTGAATATSGTDFTASSGTLTIIAGTTMTTTAIPLVGDILDESNETFWFNLNTPSSWATIADSQAVVTINDTNASPNLTLGADVSSVVEPISNTDKSPITFTITLNQASGQTVMVDYNIGGTAINSGVDYETISPSGSLVFAPGELVKTLVITTVGDIVADGNQTVIVTLSNPTNATVLANQATTTIIDSDGNPQIYFVSDASLNEGQAGLSYMVFSVQSNIQPGPYNPITITYSTVDNTASASGDSDYTASSGTVYITNASWPNTNTPIQIPIIGDTKDENNETFFVNISTTAPGVTIGDSQALGTIINDDTSPIATITNMSQTGTTATATEGNSGTTSMIFAVALDQSSSKAIALNYTTVASSATAGVDYTTKSGTLNFPIGTTGPQYIFVDVLGDTLDEINENFQVQLTGGTNASILTTTNTATGTIIDDDTVTVSIDNITQDEGNFGTTHFVFNVALSTASDRPITLTYQTVAGTATANVDYLTVSSATLTMTAGMTQTQITVVVTPDLTLESDETFFVKIISATNATVPANTQGKGTILDDDPFAAIGISDVTVTEGVNAQAIFTVTLTPAVLVATNINFSTSDGTAKAGLDYETISGTITIPAGTTQKTIAVNLINDSLKENTENFYVNLSNSTGPQISDNQGIATILDNDNAVSQTVSITHSAVTEGDTGNQTMLFTVSLSLTPGQTITVDYNTVDGTAKAGLDYGNKSGTLTFMADGSTVQTFTVSIFGDILDELTEVFTVTLSNPQNAILGQANGTGTIQDNDTTAVSMGSVSVTEGDSGTTAANLLLNLSLLSDHEVSVRYNTVNGTAVTDTDFLAQNGLITFSPGITQQTLNLTVKGDMLDELDETFKVELSQPNQLTLNTNSSTVTIKDDDTTRISISDATLLEGNSGLNEASFTLSLSLMSDRVITVAYSTASDTATANQPGIMNPDYLEALGIVTFAPMITSQVITVGIVGDTFFEADEGYYVNLTNNGVIPLADNQAKGTIMNDDPLEPDIPTVFITNTALMEGDEGLQNAVVTVTLIPASQTPITVDYFLTNGTATMNSDYQGISGTLTFAAGATVQKITIPIVGDTLSEVDETLSVNLRPTSQVEIGQGQATVTIYNDDTVAISIEPTITVQEGQAPQEAIFAVTLSAASDRLVAVEYTTQNGSATHGADFTGQNAFLSFDPGETRQEIHIPILNDSDVESPETFMVVLSNPNRAIIAESTSLATIRDDDSTATLYLDSTEITEGNNGTKNLTFNFTLWPTTTQAAQVNYQTSDETATAGSDYESATGTLNIAQGSIASQLTVPIIGDVVDEFDETFRLSLSESVNLALDQANTYGTILDDDTAEVSMSDIFVLNGPNGSNQAVFTITLSLVSDHPITFTYQTQNGTALDGQDFIAQTGIITIPAGQTSQVITIPILDNDIAEPAKTFEVILKNPKTNIETSAEGLILDDDGPARLYIRNTTVTEGNSGNTPAIFEVQLWPQPSQVVLVNYASADGVLAGKSAKVADNDYSAMSGQLTFVPNGSSRQVVAVPVAGDLKVEGDEEFMVNLSNAVGAELGLSQGTATILNDDLNPLTISDAKRVEGNSGTETLLFTVTLENVSSLPVTVDYESVANTATANEDFEVTQGTLTLAAGQKTATLPVKIIGDTTIEADETFFINLSNPTNTSLARTQAIGTIMNDDAKPIKWAYLPFIIKQPVSIVTPTPTILPSPADLIVESINATSNRVEVTIKNIGGTAIPTSQAFWVEFYVNPNPAPNAVNQSWRGRANQGVVWRVTNPGLPLAPNGSLTLIYSTEAGAANNYVVASFSQFSGNLAAGTPVYAQVDSTNASTTYGIILEGHEANNGTYNNILGPISAK